MVPVPFGGGGAVRGISAMNDLSFSDHRGQSNLQRRFMDELLARRHAYDHGCCHNL
ncbi:hypothetical protein FHT77_002613 [Rhizobium sp. BK181]|nr:hypothetical protein [Rhizobium sp. BK181]